MSSDLAQWKDPHLLRDGDKLFTVARRNLDRKELLQRVRHSPRFETWTTLPL